MWICLTDSFVSVVQDWERSAMLVVRSRKQGHLERLFPDRAVISTPRRDYAFRITITKAELADLVVGRIHGIDYSNFKASVRDDGLHDLYLDFWSLHYRYQNQTRPIERS